MKKTKVSVFKFFQSFSRLTSPIFSLCVYMCLSGFTPGARELFKRENHLALYQLPSGEKTKEFAPRRLHFIKRQPPISHLISLFVRDSSSSESTHTCLAFFHFSFSMSLFGRVAFVGFFFTPSVTTSYLPFTDNVQMLSHGSADLILEACTDFWDGSDIYPLSGSDRYVRD